MIHVHVYDDGIHTYFQLACICYCSLKLSCPRPLVSPVRQTETERRDVIEEGGREGETMRDQGDVALDRAAGAVTDITGGGTLEIGPIPVPDPDHRVWEQERDAGDHRQSGTNQRNFLSQWCRKSTMEKYPVSCSLGVLCSWKGSEVATRVWSTSRS